MVLLGSESPAPLRLIPRGVRVPNNGRYKEARCVLHIAQQAQALLLLEGAVPPPPPPAGLLEG